MPELLHTQIDSPLGEILLTGSETALTGVWFEERRHGPAGTPGRPASTGLFREATRQLDAYFAGDSTAFDLPLSTGGTPFQRMVWDELCRVPFGELRSYGEVARQLGRPAAARAVGAANGRNPISVVVPCHRLVGSDGSLTGYGGGLERKRWLIAFEAGAAAAVR